MSKGIFITGTDTGVGKTIVSAAIIRALINKGIKVGAMKPIETGCKTQRVKGQGSKVKDLIPSDGMFLREMAEMDDSIDLVTPIRFELPLAPMVASDIEQRSIDLERIFSAYKFLSQKYEFMVVEGAGGLLVPIKRQSQELEDRQQTSNIRQRTTDNRLHPKSNDTRHSTPYYFSDLIKDLKLPLIVVARPSLGTINHTLLTIREAERCGLKVCGVIINYSRTPENSIAEKTNPDVLRELNLVPVLAEIPFNEDMSIRSFNDIKIPDDALDDIIITSE